ncbi:hypothetical protein PGTUg99_050271 [Puccinia graminis f. sp. tritici]|uniref:HAT C-terminal dimerisation domain-containing protein n=2 Tax=Puccinia graminis f. sp. tritici TaxID=56615 RepID=A0A5B0R7D9_PUCGR|nr:hypothetical protein PGTUg99_050271 [Puccinia graminis f. sp. tritici]
MVFWLIRHCLPWARFEDRTLRIAMDYVDSTTKLHSRTWAAETAHKLYLAQQRTVLEDINKSDSKISLVSDVWTTKGGHKAFLGISVCYITKDWVYQCRHLSIKYISWHHKGIYLAAPFAKVLIKNELHKKILSKTTDSGSNNFTMTKELSRLIEKHDGTFWNNNVNHQRCFCHVLALILGAGLAAVKLSSAEGPTSKKPENFPTLETISEEGELFEDGVQVSEAEEEIDPDDVPASDSDSGSEGVENTEVVQNKTKGKYATSGIGLTLKKIDYVCRRICSSPAKQAEYKVWAQKLGYDGPGIIGGYGIRWNIAYESRNRAYQARKVINQLLVNETENGNGKYFNGYEFSSKEWDNIKVLNSVLKEFLYLTKRMEGDGPSCSMVLYEYSRLIDNLGQLKQASKDGILEAMFDPMIKVASKYKELALKCEPILMATMLHPAWRLLLFANKFPSHHSSAQTLLVKKFKERQPMLKPPALPPTKEASQKVDPEDEGYNFYPVNPSLDDSEDELNRYHETKFSLGIKGNVLLWWKTQAPSFPVLSSLARDYLACASSSATVERTFSAASNICTTGRSALAPRTIERCISSHLWFRNGVEAQHDFDDCLAIFSNADKNPKFNPDLIL